MMRLVLMLGVLLYLQANIYADIITLKSGLVFKGKVIEKTKQAIKIENFSGTHTIKTELIHKHTRKKSPYELYQKELEKLNESESTAEAQAKLGVWCMKKKIWHKAKFHLKKALEIDKEHKGVEKSLARVEKSWEKEVKKSSYGFTLKVGVVADMTKEEMEKLAQMIKKVSRELARTTGGMLYIKEAIFTDNTRDGNMLYNPKGPSGKPGSPTSVPSSLNNFEHGPRNWFVGCILHEFGHFMLGLADEYDTSKFGVKPAGNVFCQHCKMALRHKQGWCNSFNHPKGCPGNAPGCQEVLIARYKNKCPLLAEAFNRSEEEFKYPPETKIIIKNSGR